MIISLTSIEKEKRERKQSSERTLSQSLLRYNLYKLSCNALMRRERGLKKKALRLVLHSAQLL